jgi:NADH:ubiquinone oxidoreductase subunit 4 (subunit M)
MSTQPNNTEKSAERDIASHIFSSSAMMMGLCLTVISLMDNRDKEGRLTTMVDDLLAFDALFFLASCFLSYTALRSRHLRRMRHVETVADIIFLVGMSIMAAACALLVWTML